MKRIFTFLLLPLLAFSALEAQFSFTGTVKNEHNEPLAGATVVVNNKGYVADENGSFKITDIEKGQKELKVQYLGYNTYAENIDFTTDQIRNVVLKENVTNFEEVVVSAIRAQNFTPTTFTTIKKRDIQQLALGQDAPMILSSQTSVVSTSDAGNGVGYTGMRIRGIEGRKINVTINGVPLNDPESQGAFWVDVPDIATSSQSMQIQRGVGTSTNGSGAFGASINLQTDYISQTPFVEYSGAYGSFNTQKNSLHVGTGLYKQHFFFEGKVTGIKSDGYIDRARSNLKSYFAQAGYYSDKTIVKLVGFGGQEETYQAWYGIDSASIKSKGRTYNSVGEYFLPNDTLPHYYNDMVDYYSQDHIQLHAMHSFSDNLTFNAALHYTYGRGYYQDLSPGWYDQDYFKLPNGINGNDTITYSDVIQRLWLDNHFYGGIWGLTYTANKFTLIWGGAYNRYDPAKHYGQVIWARYFLDNMQGFHFYDNQGRKTEFNTYLKASYSITTEFSAFADVQFRKINYKAWGTNREYANDTIDIKKTYNFVNPKVGLLYQPTESWTVYTSFAVANREPSRSDFVDAEVGEEPKPEKLYDIELGTRYSEDQYNFEVNLYNMQYRDQLVLTGELNSVGTSIRKNVGKSYRMGVEMTGGIKLLDVIKLEGNVTLSKNRTDYNESVDDSVIYYKDKTIAFSPSVIAAGKITYLTPVKGLELFINTKHVGKQYLDNTENKIRSLNAYTVTDGGINYSTSIMGTECQFNFRVNNIFDEMYNSNGSVGSYSVNYYPQAGTNFMAGLTVKF
jgi:iron complex outermembrane receptor protein